MKKRFRYYEDWKGKPRYCAMNPHGVPYLTTDTKEAFTFENGIDLIGHPILRTMIFTMSETEEFEENK